jgi:hypothetical protein
MWNPVTKLITETRDVIWLHRMYNQNDVTNDIGAMPTIRFSDDHIHRRALRIMYPQRTNNLQLTTNEMGGSDPVLNQKDLEENNLIPIQEIPANEDSISEHREGDSVESENAIEFDVDEEDAPTDKEKESPSNDDDDESQHTDVSENEPC